MTVSKKEEEVKTFDVVEFILSVNATEYVIHTFKRNREFRPLRILCSDLKNQLFLLEKLGNCPEEFLKLRSLAEESIKNLEKEIEKESKII